MKVLIAGATGALGVPLVRALLAGSHQVIGLTRTPDNARSLSALGAQQPVVADAMDHDSLLKAVDGLHADAVVHALTALKKTPLRHRDMYQTNALREVGTANLLAAARAVGARTFVAESMTMGYGYGGWGEQVLTEDCPFAPPGRSQELERHLAGFRALERQLFEATQAGWIAGISLRFGAFYGPASIRPIIQMLRRRSLPLPDGGRAVMSWIYLEDAAAAVVAALARGKGGQAYNIVDDEPVRVRDFFAQLARQSHMPMPFSLPAWAMRLMAPYGTDFFATTMRVSNAKAIRELGWHPVVAPTYHQGIPRALQALGQEGIASGIRRDLEV
jgi:nucleoside-diphosphate-sugar epimerase